MITSAICGLFWIKPNAARSQRKPAVSLIFFMDAPLGWVAA